MKPATTFHLYLNLDFSQRLLHDKIPPKLLTSFNLARINNIKAFFLPHLKSTHVLSAPKRNFAYPRISHSNKKASQIITIIQLHPQQHDHNFFSIFYRIFIGFNLRIPSAVLGHAYFSVITCGTDAVTTTTQSRRNR